MVPGDPSKPYEDESMEAAAKTWDTGKLSEMLGPDGDDIIFSGDYEADRQRGTDFSEQAAQKTREMAGKSLALDPEQGESHIYLGYAGMLTYDWRTAEKEFTLGLAREPGNALGHRWFANYLLMVGNGKKALEESRTAQDLDPVSPYMISGTAKALYFLGRYDESMEFARRAIQLDPHYGVAHQHLADAYLQKHMYSEAIAEMISAR